MRRLYVCIIAGAFAALAASQVQAQVSSILLEGPLDSLFFGRDVCVGDVNGDAIPDIIVGAPSTELGPALGQVRIYFGASGMDTIPDVICVGEQIGDMFGMSVACAKDLNGDGYADVVVGAPYSDSGSVLNAGKAYVYFGGISMDSLPDLILEGSTANERFGYAVAAGDVDVRGDTTDVLVTAPGAPVDTGCVHIYLGGSAMDTISDAILRGFASEGYGLSADMGGDVNFDGWKDIIIGAPAATKGKAYVYYGDTMRANLEFPDQTLTGEFPADQFGYSVAFVGQINADSYGDVCVGAINNDHRANNAGRAYLYFGGNPMNNVFDEAFNGTIMNGNLGASVGSAGDVNGDGSNDIIVGVNNSVAGGEAYLYWGGASLDSLRDRILLGQGGLTKFGTSIASGDFNGDSLSDLVVGDPDFPAHGKIRAGRVYVFLADTARPQLGSSTASDGVVHQNGIDNDDYVLIGFSEKMNKTTISGSNVDSLLPLSKGHSWRSGSGAIGGANWNTVGDTLLVLLAATGGAPTVAVGDTILSQGSRLQDLWRNSVNGYTVIGGTFDLKGPGWVSARASDGTVLQNGVDGDDYAVLAFDEPTNKPLISEANIDNVFSLSSGHSWVSGSLMLDTTIWVPAGDTLYVYLSVQGGPPSIAVADTITPDNSTVTDLYGNALQDPWVLAGTFDREKPRMNSALASDGTVPGNGVDSDDYVRVAFSEPTNKPAVDKTSINTIFKLSNGHTWLDGMGNINIAAWNVQGDTLLVQFSDSAAQPTIAVGDTIRPDSLILQDLWGNGAMQPVVITGTFDQKGPVIDSAVASDGTVHQPGIDNDDYVTLHFDEPTQKPLIDATNVDTVLVLSNGHSWRDGFHAIKSADWNGDGTQLKISFSTLITPPTIVVGDTVKPNNRTIKDLMGNTCWEKVVVTGSFETGIEDLRAGVKPMVFALGPARPSPAKSAVTIEYQLPRPEHLEILIYDLSGRIVDRLVDQDCDAGSYSALWRTGKVASGVYFCRMAAGDFIGVEKFVLCK